MVILAHDLLPQRQPQLNDFQIDIGQEDDQNMWNCLCGRTPGSFRLNLWS